MTSPHGPCTSSHELLKELLLGIFNPSKRHHLAPVLPSPRLSLRRQTFKMSALRSSAPLGAVNAFSTASAARSHFASRLASRTTSSTRTCTTRYFSQSPAVQAQSLRGAQARCIQSQKPSQAGLQCSARTFSSTTKRHNKFKTVQQAEARHRTGVCLQR